jgi:hypothetical protein
MGKRKQFVVKKGKEETRQAVADDDEIADGDPSQ